MGPYKARSLDQIGSFFYDKSFQSEQFLKVHKEKEEKKSMSKSSSSANEENVLETEQTSPIVEWVWNRQIVNEDAHCDQNPRPKGKAGNQVPLFQ